MYHDDAHARIWLMPHYIFWSMIIVIWQWRTILAYLSTRYWSNWNYNSHDTSNIPWKYSKCLDKCASMMPDKGLETRHRQGRFFSLKADCRQALTNICAVLYDRRVGNICDGQGITSFCCIWCDLRLIHADVYMKKYTRMTASGDRISNLNFPCFVWCLKVHVSVWLCQSWTTFSLNCVRAVRLSDALCQAQSLQRSTHSLSFAQRTARCMAKLATFLKRSRDFVFECFNVDLCIKCVVATRDIQLKILWFCNRHGAIKLNYEFLSTRRCFQELIVSYFITFFSNIPMYILRYCHVRFHSNLPSQYVIIHSVL